MKVSELKDGLRRLDVEAKIIEKEETRTVNLRAGGTANVCDFTIQDETGSIKLSLWDDMIEQVKVGDKVKVENGYTNSFRGDVRVNVGRYGKLEVFNE